MIMEVNIDNRNIIEKVNELYHDFQAQEFNLVHERRHRVESIFWREIASPIIRNVEGSCILDLCSGTGFVPSVLLPILPEHFTIDCLDLSPKALEKIKEKMNFSESRLSFHVGSAEKLPFSDQSFNCVTINAGLHHVPDWQSCLREVTRILVPGGVFCLGHEPNEMYFNSNTLVKIERFIWHLFWYSSTKQNARRLRKIFFNKNNNLIDEHEHFDEINELLIEEGIIDKPLSREELRRLVDPHTHDDKSKNGFNVPDILNDYFQDYKLEILYFSDYGGDMLRSVPSVRHAYDTLMMKIFPHRGRLFSLVVRKT